KASYQVAFEPTMRLLARTGSVIRGVAVWLPHEHPASRRVQPFVADPVGVVGAGYCRGHLRRWLSRVGGEWLLDVKPALVRCLSGACFSADVLRCLGGLAKPPLAERSDSFVRRVVHVDDLGQLAAWCVQSRVVRAS